MSKFRIKTSVLGSVATNCYIVYDSDTKKAVIVDPADNASYICNQCKELGVMPEAVLLTHGHFDHIMAVPDLRRTFQFPVYVSQKEDAVLSDPVSNLSAVWEGVQLSFHGDKSVKDGDQLDFLGRSWKVIETPGHTVGSISFYVPQEEVVFSGDTLFYESYGRVDFPTGSMSQMVDSIVNKLFELPDETMVYSGHGDPTTIGHEKKYNPVSFYRR